MIRRQAIRHGVSHWLLISQVEHARLAAQLAHPWRQGDLPKFAFRPSLLAAIEHHDDGWRDWERHPGVDAASGLPRNFTEMPLPDSLDIWRQSIARCALIDHFAGWLVSGHFSALVQMVAPLHAQDESWQSLANAFSTEQAQLRHTWQTAAYPDQTTWPVAAAQGLRWLQFFDQLSLWFCCAERTDPESLTPPAGPAIRLSPTSTHSIRVEPWPWQTDALRLETIAPCVPAQTVRSADELASLPHQPVVLEWTLTR